MAYTGIGPLDNDSAADLLAELSKKKNRAVLSSLIEKRVDDCLAVLTGERTKHYVDQGNVDALIGMYGSLEKVSERIGLERDSIGYYIVENRTLAADEMVFFAGLLTNERLQDSYIITKASRRLAGEMPSSVTRKIMAGLQISLSDDSVTSEWLRHLGQQKIDLVAKIRDAVAKLN